MKTMSSKGEKKNIARKKKYRKEKWKPSGRKS